MVPLGTKAPDFSLIDPGSTEILTWNDCEGDRGTLVMFICNHCPYVKFIAGELARLGEEYIPRGIGMVAINSNDATSYPADSPEKMVEEAEKHGYPFPYLYDEIQSVAQAYGAACTPDFFLFDSDRLLVYRGQLDDARPGGVRPVTGIDMRRAFDALIKSEMIDPEQRPSIGCNIKWKS
jgi:peroxiredoxin